MKNLQRIVLLIAVLFCSATHAQQTEAAANNTIFNTVDIRPVFPGGISEFYKFIGDNYRCPKGRYKSGKVYVQFVVEKDGSLADIKVIRDLGSGTGEEAVRVLKLCPKWQPGLQDDKPVRVLYSLPIAIQSEPVNIFKK